MLFLVQDNFHYKVNNLICLNCLKNDNNLSNCDVINLSKPSMKWNFK